MPISNSESSVLFKFSSVFACWMVLADVSNSADWSGKIFSDLLALMELKLMPCWKSLSWWSEEWLLCRLLMFLYVCGSFWSHDDYFWDKWDLLLLVLILLVLVYFTSHAEVQNSTSTSKPCPTPPITSSRSRCRPSWPILASPLAISNLLAFSPMATTATVHCVSRFILVV